MTRPVIVFAGAVYPGQFGMLCDHLRRCGLAETYFLTTPGHCTRNAHRGAHILSFQPDGPIVGDVGYYYSRKVERSSRIGRGLYQSLAALQAERPIDVVVCHSLWGAPHLLFDEIDAAIEVILVNVRYAKNVPGRKTDVSDAGWLRQMHSYGLLRGSFRPDAEIAALCAYMCQRERLTEYAADHIQHMQKALMEMNLQLHHVVSDITDATGMKIIREIVAGERDPEVQADYRDVRCKSSLETIRAALVGNDRAEHIFALAQSLDLYDFCKAKIEECDQRLEEAVAALSVKSGEDLPPLPKAHVKGRRVNAPAFDIRAAFTACWGPT